MEINFNEINNVLLDRNSINIQNLKIKTTESIVVFEGDKPDKIA